MRRLAIALITAACSSGCGSPGGGPATPGSTTVTPASGATATGSTPASTTNAVPPVSPEAGAVGFVDVRTAVPNAIIDLRYSTSNNFLHAPLYPADARCLVHESMAPGLAAAAGALHQGEALVFWDCYRPHDVQVRMFQAVADPNWVARPGQYSRSHEAGRSVDVTIANAQEQCPPGNRLGSQCLTDMGTDFDEFSSRANAFATQDVSETEQANRARLREVMGTGGLTPYSGEWWHFDGPAANVERPIINVPVN
ncbi:M15 family metallopeptidase [Mycobacterium sp. Z3061]|uniref:M15 family metallopeptidase n=1 Tax=Mycobacterium sp. Z3061 TaxID=3073562 RepID=UPI002872C640|nr:M15 family metallopeptidase [Mycobacterium sp. Z3061]